LTLEIAASIYSTTFPSTQTDPKEPIHEQDEPQFNISKREKRK
jgi:hypothetical protein